MVIGIVIGLVIGYIAYPQIDKLVKIVKRKIDDAQ
jgi:hypothetical protein